MTWSPRSNLVGQWFITAATMVSRQASEGGGLLWEEITHLSGAEIVVRMIRQRKCVRRRQTNTSFILHNLVGIFIKVDGTPLQPINRYGSTSVSCVRVNESLFLRLFMAPRGRLDQQVWSCEWRKCPNKEQTSSGRKWAMKRLPGRRR